MSIWLDTYRCALHGGPRRRAATALEPITALILNRQADEYSRSAGVTALAFLAAWAEVPRAQVIDCLLWLAREASSVSESRPRALVQTMFVERDGQFSPNGRWIAFMSNDTGRFEVYVQRFPGPGGRIRVSVNGGSHVRWARSGTDLFFIAPDGHLMVAAVTLGERALKPRRGSRPRCFPLH